MNPPVAVPTPGAAHLATDANDVAPGRLRALVEALPPRRSRLHVPDAIERADAIIADHFAAHGWSTSPVPFEYRDVDGYEDVGTLRRGRWGPTRYGHVAGLNIVAVREGEHARDAVVVLAHHDTPRDLPGADDNAAGVAVILELARILGGESFGRTIVLAAVDMEEIGMFGSRALVEQLERERRVVGAVVFDTIAYTDNRPNTQWLPPGIGLLYPRLVRKLRRRGMRGNWTAILYRGFSRHLASAVGQALEDRIGAEKVVLLRDPGDLPIVGRLLRATLPMVRQFGRSDHMSFWDAAIPAIVVTDTTFFRNPHYHELTDLPETLDYERLAAITAATASAVRRLAADGAGGPRR